MNTASVEAKAPVRKAILPVKTLHKNAKLPRYETSGAAGMDLSAAFDGDPIPVEPGKRAMIPTGLAIDLSAIHQLLCPGMICEAQIRPRSGLAAKHGITVLNAPGTIDADFRGEIKVILHNTSDRTFYVNSGDRVAQMVIAPILQVKLLIADELNESSRGEGGFGSTGI